MRRLFLLFAASCCLLIACGGSDGVDSAESSTDDEAAATTEAPATTSEVTAAPETTAAPAETTTTAAEAAPAAAAPDGAIEMVLAEWSLTGPAELTAGPQDFLVVNAGAAKHNLVIVRGDGYESLPLESNGAVIETDLAPEDIIGKTSTFDGGGISEVLSVDLPPGNYVFYCNLAFGPSSHARNGQRLDVTVTG